MFRNRILSLLLVLCLECAALCAGASAELHGPAGVSVSAAAEGMPGLKAASNGKNRVKSIKLSEKKLLLAPGFSARITATVAPDTAEVKEVTWISSKPEVDGGPERNGHGHEEGKCQNHGDRHGRQQKESQPDGSGEGI